MTMCNEAALVVMNLHENYHLTQQLPSCCESVNFSGRRHLEDPDISKAGRDQKES